MTLFLRQTLLYQGETNKELNEARQLLKNETAAHQETEGGQLDELWIATLSHCSGLASVRVARSQANLAGRAWS